MNLPCTQAKNNSHPKCGEATWIIAWICDTCDENGTTELCYQHYSASYHPDGYTIRICVKCYSSISLSARHINGTQGIEIIHQ